MLQSQLKHWAPREYVNERAWLGTSETIATQAGWGQIWQCLTGMQLAAVGKASFPMACWTL